MEGSSIEDRIRSGLASRSDNISFSSSASPFQGIGSHYIQVKVLTASDSQSESLILLCSCANAAAALTAGCISSSVRGVAGALASAA